jgi:hypothetical protein
MDLDPRAVDSALGLLLEEQQQEGTLFPLGEHAHC